MKKIFITLIIFTVGFAGKSMAQRMGGNFDPAQMKARQLEQLKASNLHLTDVQADSVVSINMDMMQQTRGMRDLSRDERMAKMKALNDLRMKRWTAALNNDPALAQKVADFYEQERKQRMQNRNQQ
ncbi:MAG: hypothetical protein K2W79_13395 [Hydrotalea flava]|uniref:hypothetical protein n=1 Tax=Hydrotalea TaxID=1004300 RepID=UPI0009464E4F|nr:MULTISPECIES: hypothetical protein [Hydrotalea]MBY0349247.1 hypothetical protein [Hydrotalea flava]RWZ88843.1 MAG: hypothetical protein EO766_06760 [Hydrotalea sp. AMD]